MDAACWGAAPPSFDTDVPAPGSGFASCTLPGFTGYGIVICAPGEAAAAGPPCATQTGRGVNTISVRVTEDAATAMAGIFGASSVTVGGFSAAEYAAGSGASGGLTFSSQLPLALFSAGCLTVAGNQGEVVQGDVYVDTCGVDLSGGAGAGLCARATAVTAGNVTFGPGAPAPAGGVAQSYQGGCPAGKVSGPGRVGAAPVGLLPPRFVPPPGFATTNLVSPAPAAAVANQLCANGTSGPSGSALSDCFSPGVYTSVTGIANNLNPGVYYVLGDPGACGAGGCTGVTFAGDTMNANHSEVAGSCWSAPWASCSGFQIDPGAAPIVDPQCPPTAAGCPASPGFHNVPGATQSYGVTFVLLGRAMFCLSVDCGASATTRTVLLSPHCAGAACGPAAALGGDQVNDGAFTIYGPTQGQIAAPGNTRLGAAGTVYAPAAPLRVGGGVFELIPGQAIVHDASLATSNPGGVPDVFFPCCTSLGVAGTSLPGAQQSPAVHLVR
jgi:hypothetical protein